MSNISPIVKLLRSVGERERITQAEIRKDYLQEQYVLIAPRRGARPHATDLIDHSHNDKVCAFCPDDLNKKEIIKLYGGSNWKQAVIINKFPAVSVDNPKAYGRQEIVIETPLHSQPLEELPAARLAELLAVYGDRLKAIEKDKKIEYVIIFKSFGTGSGATLGHAHSQIIGSSFVSPHLRDKTDREHHYQGVYGRCPYCDIIKEETRGPRKIFSDQHVAVFAPYASMHAYEAWLMPKRHVDNVSQLTAIERLSMAKALKAVLGGVAALGVPYNYYFHERVKDTDQHLYIKVTPRGAIWGPVEISQGLVINPVPPESAAKFYRERF